MSELGFECVAYVSLSLEGEGWVGNPRMQSAYLVPRHQKKASVSHPEEHQPLSPMGTWALLLSKSFLQTEFVHSGQICNVAVTLSSYFDKSK